MNELIDDPFFVQGVEAYHRGDFLDDCPFDFEPWSSEAERWRMGWYEGNKSKMFRHDINFLSLQLGKPLSFLRFDFDYDG
jgi:hypothetical protein